MTVELVGGSGEQQKTTFDVYRPPCELIRDSELARSTLQTFLLMYGSRCVGELPPIERYAAGTDMQRYVQEVWTGYGGLGEIVHIRVIPALMDEVHGYFVARANLHTGEIDEPPLARVDRFTDNAGPQTDFYFDDERCNQWPPEYQPMIHFDQMSYRLTYRHGFGAGESLLRPIEELAVIMEASRGVSEPIGRRALELVHSAPAAV